MRWCLAWLCFVLAVPSVSSLGKRLMDRNEDPSPDKDPSVRMEYQVIIAVLLTIFVIVVIYKTVRVCRTFFRKSPLDPECVCGQSDSNPSGSRGSIFYVDSARPLTHVYLDVQLSLCPCHLSDLDKSQHHFKDLLSNDSKDRSQHHLADLLNKDKSQYLADLLNNDNREKSKLYVANLLNNHTKDKNYVVDFINKDNKDKSQHHLVDFIKKDKDDKFENHSVDVLRNDKDENYSKEVLKNDKVENHSEDVLENDKELKEVVTSGCNEDKTHLEMTAGNRAVRDRKGFWRNIWTRKTSAANTTQCEYTEIN